MWDTLRQRLMVLGVLLIVAALAGGTIAVLQMQKAIQGSNEASISVIKLPNAAESATQRAELQAKHNDLLMTLISIASNNSTVQAVTAGKNVTVVGTGVDKGGLSQEPSDVGASLLVVKALGTGVDKGGLSQEPSDVGIALLVIKADSKFFAITEDVPHKQVTAVEERACYGPLCDR